MTPTYVRIGDVLQLQRRSIEIVPSEEYQLIGVYSFGKGIFHRDAQPGAALGGYRYFRVLPGDLVLSNIQAWEGAISYATEADRGTIGTHRFLTYTPLDEAAIDCRWARWFLLSEPGMDLIRKAAPGTTMRNRTLAIERFEKTEIPLPSIETQRRVADRLDAADQSSNWLTSEMARANDLAMAARVAMVSLETLSDRERKAQGWHSVMLGDAVEPTHEGESVEPTRRYRIAGVYSYGRGLIDRGEILGSETSYRTFTCLRKDDIVFSKLGAWEGAVAVVTSDFAGCSVSSEFPTFAINTDVLDPNFFQGVTRAPWFWAAINADTRGSMARRKRIAPNQFLKVQIELPSLDHQRRVTTQLHELDRLEILQADARAIREALVPSIMNEEFARYS